MSESPQTYENIHGRKQGRGFRPYLLIVKLFAIAVCVGTLTAVLALVFLHSQPENSQVWQFEIRILRGAYQFLIVPAVNLALLMGLILFLHHPKEFLRMRWIRAKLILILLTLPALHLLMRGWMHQLSELVPPETEVQLAEALAVRQRLIGGTAAALSIAVLLIILGRIKPRLGQDYGKTFSQGRIPRPPENSSSPEN